MDTDKTDCELELLVFTHGKSILDGPGFDKESIQKYEQIVQEIDSPKFKYFKKPQRGLRALEALVGTFRYPVHSKTFRKRCARKESPPYFRNLTEEGDRALGAKIILKLWPAVDDFFTFKIGAGDARFIALAAGAYIQTGEDEDCLKYHQITENPEMNTELLKVVKRCNKIIYYKVDGQVSRDLFDRERMNAFGGVQERLAIFQVKVYPYLMDPALGYLFTDDNLRNERTYFTDLSQRGKINKAQWYMHSFCFPPPS